MTAHPTPAPNQAHVNSRDIAAGLERLGVHRGDTVMVHSSLSSLGWVDGGADAVIDALLEVIGPTGLLIMPTHTWSIVNASQPAFHQQLTPSVVGQITEVFRHRARVVRSLHPTHSVAALGADADQFVAGHECYSTPCSTKSPYGRLVDRGGYVLLLGVGLESFTLMHGFEEWAAVPWLFNRTEQLWSVTATGEVLAVRSRRHTDHPVFRHRDFPLLEPVLADHNAIRTGTIGAATARLVDAAAARSCLVPLLVENPNAVVRKD